MLRKFKIAAEVEFEDHGADIDETMESLYNDLIIDFTEMDLDIIQLEVTGRN
jgi:hypothetical protein